MKIRLFICSNYLTMLESAYVIESTTGDYENHLMIVSFGCKKSFFRDMLKLGRHLNVFHKIYFYSDLVKPDNKFDFEKLETLTHIKGYDEIYTTCFYMQSKIFIEKYKDAELCLLSNGTASYQPQSLLGNLYKKVKCFYYIDYFDNRIAPYLCTDLGIKSCQIDKNYLINKFTNLSKQVQPNGEPFKKNSVILIAQNLYISKLATLEQEFNEYKKVMDYYVSKGYNIYFKNHPRSAQTFYNPIKNIYKEKVSIIDGYDTFPIESLIYKIEPEAVISMSSTALFNTKDLFYVPSYTFDISFEIKNSPIKLAYAMIKSYFNDYDKTTINPLLEIPELSSAPLYQMLLHKMTKLPIKKETALKIKKYLKDENYSNRYKNFGIDEALFNNFKSPDL